MQISIDPSMALQQRLQPSSLPEHTAGGWYQKFMAHPLQKTHELSQQDTSMAFRGLGVSTFGPINNYSPAGVDPDLISLPGMHHQPTMFPGDQFDDAAFERAFAAASSDILKSEVVGEQLQNTELEHGTPGDSEKQLPAVEPSLGHQATPSIGADTILENTQQEKMEGHEDEDSDALARTAGQLLDSVRHNQSQKFQESNFLALMRQLRDREVRVEGDKIVNTDSQNGELQQNGNVDPPSHT